MQYLRNYWSDMGKQMIFQHVWMHFARLQLSLQQIFMQQLSSLHLSISGNTGCILSKFCISVHRSLVCVLQGLNHHCNKCPSDICQYDICPCSHISETTDQVLLKLDMLLCKNHVNILICYNFHCKQCKCKICLRWHLSRHLYLRNKGSGLVIHQKLLIGWKGANVVWHPTSSSSIFDCTNGLLVRFYPII